MLAEVNGFIMIQVSSIDAVPNVKSCTYCFVDFIAVGVASYIILGITNLLVFISGRDVYYKALVDAEVRCDFVLGLSYDFPWYRFHQLIIFVYVAE